MEMIAKGRHCGAVYVVHAAGRIVAGEETRALEEVLLRGFREFKRFVLDVREVTRVDSTGMGMLVRFLLQTRKTGGDLRLAAPAPFFVELLKLTNLNSLFQCDASEDEALLSFLKGPGALNSDAAASGAKVLFIDQSPDVCAFVRTLLQHHGYQVSSTCRLHDAKTLLTATAVDYIVLGPDVSSFNPDSVVFALKPLAPNAAIVQLHTNFKHEDPERAGLELLRLMQCAAQS